MIGKVVVAILALLTSLCSDSKDFYHRYYNNTYKYAIALPKDVRAREFNSEEADIIKGTDLTKAHNWIARLRVIPLEHTSDVRINSNDDLARSAITECINGCLGGGADLDIDCEPTDSISFATLTSGVRYVKFYLIRHDNDTYGSHTALVGPFYGFDISRPRRSFVLVISDGGYLMPLVNDQRLQWQVAKSLVLTE